MGRGAGAGGGARDAARTRAEAASAATREAHARRSARSARSARARRDAMPTTGRARERVRRKLEGTRPRDAGFFGRGLSGVDRALLIAVERC
eukprot:31417-Pelagococcus_subviridis.AAC.11